jgi:Restriction endonuclease
VARTPEKPTLWTWLLRQDLEGVHSCRSLLEAAARACLGKDAVSAAAYTEAIVTPFWNYVIDACSDHASRGISASFAIADPITKTWQCYPVSDESPEPERQRALLARNRPSLLRTIDQLNDRQYEALSCVLLEALGGARVNLTKTGGEGGIDAFGLLLNTKATHLLGSSQHPIRVIVQSKMHRRPMAADKMKEFIETLNEVKYGGQSRTEAVIPDWFRAARGPRIGAAISHAGFQAGAEARARSHGILIVDSIDIAEVLSTWASPASRADGCLARITELLGDG